MTEKQRSIFNSAKKISAIIGAIVVLVSTVGTVYSWYFKGEEYIKKVDKVEVKIEDHEKRLVEGEKFLAVQKNINHSLENIDKKITVLLLRGKIKESEE